MELRMEVSFEDFIKLHGDDRTVFPFSPQARELIYNKIVDLQQHHMGCPTEIDWSDQYCYASEMTSREIYEDNEKIITDNARDLFDIAASYKHICDKLGLNLSEDDDDEDYRYDIDIIADNKDYLIRQEGFLKEAVALILSKLEDGFDALDNGNWLTYGN